MKTEQQIREELERLNKTTENINNSKLSNGSKNLYIRVNDNWIDALEWVLESEVKE